MHCVEVLTKKERYKKRVVRKTGRTEVGWRKAGYDDRLEVLGGHETNLAGRLRQLVAAGVPAKRVIRIKKSQGHNLQVQSWYSWSDFYHKTTYSL